MRIIVFTKITLLHLSWRLLSNSLWFVVMLHLFSQSSSDETSWVHVVYLSASLSMLPGSSFCTWKDLACKCDGSEYAILSGVLSLGQLVPLLVCSRVVPAVSSFAIDRLLLLNVMVWVGSCLVLCLYGSLYHFWFVVRQLQVQFQMHLSPETVAGFHHTISYIHLLLLLNLPCKIVAGILHSRSIQFCLMSASHTSAVLGENLLK